MFDILANKPLSFQSILIEAFIKLDFPRLDPKTVYHRNFENFDENSFLNDLKETNFDFFNKSSNENYRSITDTFIKVVERHAPLEKRFVRGNQVPFMNKELKKAIYARSRLRNNFCKSPTNKNEKSTKYNKTNVCFLEGKVLRNILRTFRKDGVVTNKIF